MYKFLFSLVWPIGISCLSLAAPSIQAENITQGAMLSISCAGCHGTDGKSPGAIPGIYGRSADFINTSLLEFRSGKRSSTVMGRLAKGYNEDEIRQIAEYLSSIK
jgi:sulfide dehydrogenase cytochrome subunit